MATFLCEGWVCVPYSGDELASIFLAVGDQACWYPAFRDWSDDTRVVKVRPPARHGQCMVWLSVDGQVTQVGVVTL